MHAYLLHFLKLGVFPFILRENLRLPVAEVLLVA